MSDDEDKKTTSQSGENAFEGDLRNRTKFGFTGKQTLEQHFRGGRSNRCCIVGVEILHCKDTVLK